jgi:sulfur relay (sulfurtransferase) DsrC/TusE family protein
VAVVFGLLPWVIIDRISNPAEAGQTGSRWELWQFWFQTFAGNWSPPPHPIMSPWWFAVSAVLAVVLNTGMWAALFAAWRLVANGRRTMRLSQAFAVRDQMNRQELYRLFGRDPATRSKIREAFVKGQQNWEREMIEMFGPKEARVLQNALPKEIGGE